MVPELLILNDFSEKTDIILPAMMKIFSVLTGNQHLPGFLRNNRTAAIRIAVPSLFFIFALYNQQFPTIHIFWNQIKQLVHPDTGFPHDAK